MSMNVFSKIVIRDCLLIFPGSPERVYTRINIPNMDSPTNFSLSTLKSGLHKTVVVKPIIASAVILRITLRMFTLRLCTLISYTIYFSNKHNLHCCIWFQYDSARKKYPDSYSDNSSTSRTSWTWFESWGNKIIFVVISADSEAIVLIARGFTYETNTKRSEFETKIDNPQLVSLDNAAYICVD